jgi:hypothetical protein
MDRQASATDLEEADADAEEEEDGKEGDGVHARQVLHVPVQDDDQQRREDEVACVWFESKD